jgi:signal transduction histidine kinase
MISNYTLIVVIVLLLSIVMVFLAKVANHKVLSEKNKLQQTQLKHQKELIRINFEAQEKERKRIAHELHDEVGAKLHIINMMLKNQQADSKEKILNLTDTTLDSVRRISHEMYPPMLEEFGLEFSLQQMQAQLNEGYRFYLSFLEKRKIPIQIEVQLLRIIQEFISNTIKHARANEIGVQIKSSSSHLKVRLFDNGRGVNPSVQNKGLGISSIQSRLEFLEGKYKWKSIPNQGTRLISIMNYEED